MQRKPISIARWATTSAAGAVISGSENRRRSPIAGPKACLFLFGFGSRQTTPQGLLIASGRGARLRVSSPPAPDLEKGVGPMKRRRLQKSLRLITLLMLMLRPAAYSAAEPAPLQGLDAYVT